MATGAARSQVENLWLRVRLRHEQFIAENATEWAKVRVFDAEVAAK